MSIFNSIALAFTLFSRIPAPRVEWNERNMRYLMAALPLVGMVISALIAAWWCLCDIGSVGVFARTAGLVIIPLAITGGIHLDGFCDVVDALSSHAEPERKRAILKDPHVGAFAVMGVAAYFIVQLAAYSELNTSLTTLWLIVALPVASRTLAGLAVLHVPRCSSSGMGSSFQQAGAKTPVTAVLVIVLVACLCWMCAGSVWAGVAIGIAAVVSFVYVATLARRQFGGMSGDVAGFYVQLLELILPLCLVIVQKVVGW